MFNWLDIIITLLVGGFIWRGYMTGLIKTVGSFAGVILGAAIASRLYLLVFDFIKPVFFGLDNIGRVISFLLVFAIFSKIIYLIFAALDKTYDFLTIIPFLKSINRLGGAILGLVVGALIISLIFYVCAKYIPLNGFIDEVLSNSRISPWLLVVADVFLPILSGGLKSLKSII